MVEELYPSQSDISNRNEGGEQILPQRPTTRLRIKKGAQHTTKVEKTTPRTRLAFSSDTVLFEGVGGLGANGKAAKIVFPLSC